jgi:hypothetical protein
MTTPHQRRVRELEASRRLQAELQGLIDSHSGTIPSVVVAEAFERAGGRLPEGSEERLKFDDLARGLRSRSARYLGEDTLRRVIRTLRQRSDVIGAGIEARDARLRQKR